jgi:enediyne biosynthesis protein E4
MYVNDFDGNGSVEQIFCSKIDGRYYPIADKDDFLSQLPSRKKDFIFYKDYSKKAIEEIFAKSVLANTKVLEVKSLASVMFLSSPTGYVQSDLPLEAQYSPIYSLLVSDFDGDSVDDLMAGGNQHLVKPQFGRYDASNGWFFKGGLNKEGFTFASGQALGVKGQIRDIELVEVNGTKYIFFVKYDDDLEIYKIPN